MNQAVIASVDGILHSGIDFGVFDGKTVLISGANGFVPSYLAYALLERNRRYDSKTKLILLCRNLERANTRFAEYLFDPHLELLIQDAWGRVKSEEKTHYVICAASPAGIQSRQANSLFTYETNLFGTKNALDYAKEHGCERFLFISSVDVYGKLCDTGRLSEDNLGYLDMFYPRNAYSNGKRSAETICSLYFDGHGLQTVIARPFQIYGPGMSRTRHVAERRTASRGPYRTNQEYRQDNTEKRRYGETVFHVYQGCGRSLVFNFAERFAGQGV
jgi:nucleoside-diphosphate-sugar epimerase